LRPPAACECAVVVARRNAGLFPFSFRGYYLGQRVAGSLGEQPIGALAIGLFTDNLTITKKIA